MHKYMLTLHTTHTDYKCTTKSTTTQKLEDYVFLEIIETNMTP